MLVLLIYHNQENSKNISCINVWDIKLCKESQGSDICINILCLHDTLGCDTTAGLYGFVKKFSLFSLKIQQQAAVFQKDLVTPEEIASSGITHACLYKRKESERFDEMRYSIFCGKAA